MKQICLIVALRILLIFKPLEVPATVTLWTHLVLRREVMLIVHHVIDLILEYSRVEIVPDAPQTADIVVAL